MRTPRRLGTTIATGAVVLALAACGAGSSSAGSTVEKPRPTSAASTRWAARSWGVSAVALSSASISSAVRSVNTLSSRPTCESAMLIQYW